MRGSAEAPMKGRQGPGSKVNTEQKSSESSASMTGLRRPEPTLPAATVNTTFDFEEGLHTQVHLRNLNSPQRRKLAFSHNHRSAVAVLEEAAGVSTMLDFQMRTMANRRRAGSAGLWHGASGNCLRVGQRGACEGGGGCNDGEELIVRRSTPPANRDQRATKDDKNLAWDSAGY